jgi:hypothetical protein
MKPPPDADYRHRFPAEIIRHAVWFSLSLRDVELLLAERGVEAARCAQVGVLDHTTAFCRNRAMLSRRPGRLLSRRDLAVDQ